MDGIRDALLKNIEYVSPLNLNGTVKLFKRFGRESQAAEMIAQYLLARGDQPKLFDLGGYPFRSDVDDPELRAAFERKASEARDIPDFIALLESSKDDWSKEVIETLASATVENYRQAFKSREGDEHRRLVFNALQFSKSWQRHGGDATDYRESHCGLAGHRGGVAVQRLPGRPVRRLGKTSRPSRQGRPGGRSLDAAKGKIGQLSARDEEGPLR